MQSDKLQKNQNIETARPAPILPGFYSLQTLSTDASSPNITQYHRKPEPAMLWKDKMVKTRLYDAFILCSSEARWDLFNRRGKMIGTKASILPESGVLWELKTPVAVDKAEYEASVRAVLGDSVCCLAFAEHHAYASSVGHSNMVVIAHKLIVDASEEDAKHVYLADSVTSGCRVQGWFIDSQRISANLMNKYLDRYKWLSNGWPLANDHHLQVMSYRMATLRRNQVLDLMMTVADAAHVGEHRSMMISRLQQADQEIMILFCSRMLEGMESGILIQAPQALEVIDSEMLFQHSERIAALYKEMFL